MNRIRAKKQILVLVLLSLYCLGITSFASIHFIHDLFHFVENSQHLHDHSHNHHDHYNKTHDHFSEHEGDPYYHESSKPEKNNHGHRHNKYIDTILQSIDKEPEIPESHVLFVLEMYYHMNFILEDQIRKLAAIEKKHYKEIELMSTLCHLSPPTPPPKV